MAKLQCKMCGGMVDVPEGAGSAECPYCGSTTTFPKASSTKAEQQYARAEHFRHAGDFDKAMEAYENVIRENPDDAEAYWGLVLSRFGIEYVEDPVSHERIPTCHRVQYKSILADEDYLSALEKADAVERDIYEREAKRIAEIQKGILAISAKEKPFDVFLCYKETTDGGSRTRDSVIAQEIYYGLTNGGYKVFFARITLEKKLGQEYEPYIFAALQSAKVMLVIGTSKEHFNAVWVRNEWSRFLALMREDRSRLLIPCYRDMDAYDIPDELSMLQAQDMSKIGFLQDILSGVAKVLRSGVQEDRNNVVVNPTASSSVAPLLERISIFLQSGDFESANQYCERVLDKEPKNAQAYLYKLLAECKLKSEDELYLVEDLSSLNSYQLAMRFADASTKGKIEAQCQKHENYGKYQILKDRMAKAYTLQDWQSLENEFASLGDIPEAEQSRRDCAGKAEVLLEEVKQHYEDLVQRWFSENENRDDISPAEWEMASDDFQSIGQLVPEALEMSSKCLEIASEKRWNKALRRFQAAQNKEDYEALIPEFNKLKHEFPDAVSKEEQCRENIRRLDYQRGVRLMEVHFYTSAIQIFQSLDGYGDSLSLMYQCRDAKRKRDLRFRNIVISVCILLISVCILLLFIFVSAPKLAATRAYWRDRVNDAKLKPLQEQAEVALSQGDYEKTIQLAESMKPIKEEAFAYWYDRVNDAKLKSLQKQAEEAFEQGDYEKTMQLAKAMSTIMGGTFAYWRDMVNDAKLKPLQEQAEAALAQGDYEKTMQLVESMKPIKEEVFAVWRDKVNDAKLKSLQEQVEAAIKQKRFERAMLLVESMKPIKEEVFAVWRDKVNDAKLKSLQEQVEAAIEQKEFETAMQLAESMKPINGEAFAVLCDKVNDAKLKFLQEQVEAAIEQKEFETAMQFAESMKPIKEKVFIVWRDKVNDAKLKSLPEQAKTAFEQGDYKKTMQLAELMRNFMGENFPKDYPDAVKWYRKAAEQGDITAQYHLGDCYYYGNGVPKNRSEAAKWFRKAAEQGNAAAQYMTGVCSLGERPNFDYTKAAKWFRNAAEQGYAKAQYALGCYYYQGYVVPQDYAEAVKWLRKAAEQGYADAQNQLGWCFYEGKGVPQDLAEAAKWFRMSAEQGYAYAQYNLGNHYFNGRNYAEAVKWYRKAAEQGHSQAQCDLGECYYYGHGVPQDYAEAVKWLRKAAEQGHSQSQNKLGWCYENGQGVQADYTEAEKWYLKAAEQGNEDAIKNLKNMLPIIH